MQKETSAEAHPVVDD